MPLLVDPLVFVAMGATLDFWKGAAAAPEIADRLSEAFMVALWRIETEPERGLRIMGLPADFRRVRLARSLPGYIFFYRIEAEQVLLFLLRHERQRPYAPETIRRKAMEAARRTAPE